MIKKLLFALIAAGSLQGAAAQERESSNRVPSEKTLFEEITNIKAKQDKFHLLLNMHGNFDTHFDDGVSNGAFHMKQLRIEAKGNINDWLSYRYRQRVNRCNSGGDNIDNMPTSIDIAGIGVKLGKGFSLFAGKQCAAYGGVEFDLNPIEIYEYSDMIENMSNFMTGINLGYDLNERQQLNFQILDSRNGSFESTYGVEEGADITEGKMPLLYTLNWNGTFGNFKTRWSASLLNEAKSENMYYLAFGNELTAGNFNMFLDVMYSNEAIDRKCMMTRMVGGMNGHNANDASYFSTVTKLNYRFSPKWNLFAKGMYETASLGKAQNGFEKGKYSTSLGYLAGLEFYPMESNLHFFLTYIGRSYKYTDRAKALGQENHSTNRISIGFIYQLPMF